MFGVSSLCQKSGIFSPGIFAKPAHFGVLVKLLSGFFPVFLVDIFYIKYLKTVIDGGLVGFFGGSMGIHVLAIMYRD